MIFADFPEGATSKAYLGGYASTYTPSGLARGAARWASPGRFRLDRGVAAPATALVDDEASTAT